MRIVILFLLVAGVSPVFGQTRFGIEAGANLATIGAGWDESRWGPHVGLSAQFPERGRFSFRTSLQYSLKGLEQKEYYVRKENLLRFDFHYLSVPLTASYRLSERLSLSLGPVVSYLLASRVAVGGTPLDLPKDGEDGFADWDFGLQAGLSFNFKNGFGLYTRYEAGFTNMVNTNLMDEKGRSVGRASSGTNRVWQFGASYALPMRRGQ